MLIIGLTGGSGSGKGTASAILSRYGIPSIDTDSVYREMTCKGGECIKPLVLSFGDKILRSDGSLDRAALAKAVFSGNNAKANQKKLESVTHPLILNKVRQMILSYENTQNPPAIIVDAPQLFESGFDSECDFIIAVIANSDVRVRRIMKRDGISAEAAMLRISAQASDEFLREHSNFVVTNNSDEVELENQLNKIIKIIFDKEKIK